MIAILPINKFRVSYEIAKGRPYSPLEKRILEHIDVSPVSLAELDETFMVHQRLIVESIVTLVGAGWVAVSSGTTTKFVCTAEGRAALASERGEPVSVVVAPARPQVLIVERLTGQIARQRGLRTYRRADLRDVWSRAVHLPARIFRNSIDEARVQRLLPRDPSEWIRWIGPMWLISKNQHFLPVDVDLKAGEVRGLPSTWLAYLGPIILELCREAYGEVADMNGTAREEEGALLPQVLASNEKSLARQTEMKKVSPGSFVRLEGKDAHDTFLRRCLEAPGGGVFIASPGATESRLTSLEPALADAARAGTRVDLLPGSVAPGSTFSQLVALANQIGYHAAGSRTGRQLLRMGSRPTGSGGCLVLTQSLSGISACVGNYRWLSDEGDGTSIVVTDSRLVAELARVAAVLWAVISADGSGAAGDRWRHLASLTEERAAVGAPADISMQDAGIRMRVVVDDEHLFVVNDPNFLCTGSYEQNDDRELECDGVSLVVERGALADGDL